MTSNGIVRPGVLNLDNFNVGNQPPPVENIPLPPEVVTQPPEMAPLPEVSLAGAHATTLEWVKVRTAKAQDLRKAVSDLERFTGETGELNHFLQGVDRLIARIVAKTNESILDSDDAEALRAAVVYMKVCVYMMTDLALRMEIEDGTNATVQDLVQSITQEEQLRLPRIASTVFTLWMSSGLLELQLKAHHKPLQIRNKWSVLLAKYAHASESRQRRDEPVLSFKRNVFYPLNQEERIKDEKILELLYAEAKYNILEGRYPCDVTQYIMLGSIQARIELGPYNPQYHTLHFFREQQGRFLPSHIRN
ncbi:FERM domain-containing protein 8, partial [Halyomorpha halys]|uniref:FERM domain-containing protein 8 n=1 Tax=Halyomorpha halys TaxID=286706 RepID=UPI0034D37980